MNARPQLTQDQEASFRENGYLAVEGLFPGAHVRGLRNRIEELCQEWESDEARQVGVQHETEVSFGRRPPSADTVRKFSELARHEALFWRHATDPALLDFVEGLIGGPLLLYADQALLKPPGVGSAKPPHQDNAYFRVEPADAVLTAWTALDDATQENGCMRYFAGTHHDGLVEHTAIKGTPHLVPEGRRPEEATPTPVKSGGVIFHHAEVLHCSDDNTSNRWRRAFVCHYVREGARLNARHPNSPPLPRVR